MKRLLWVSQCSSSSSSSGQLHFTVLRFLFPSVISRIRFHKYKMKCVSAESSYLHPVFLSFLCNSESGIKRVRSNIKLMKESHTAHLRLQPMMSSASVRITADPSGHILLKNYQTVCYLTSCLSEIIIGKHGKSIMCPILRDLCHIIDVFHRCVCVCAGWRKSCAFKVCC